jgi:hypothetical protein
MAEVREVQVVCTVARAEKVAVVMAAEAKEEEMVVEPMEAVATGAAAVAAAKEDAWAEEAKMAAEEAVPWVVAMAIQRKQAAASECCAWCLACR